MYMVIYFDMRITTANNNVDKYHLLIVSIILTVGVVLMNKCINVAK